MNKAYYRKEYVKAEQWTIEETPLWGMYYLTPVYIVYVGRSKIPQQIHLNDWIVSHDEGTLEVLTPVEFENIYTAAENDHAKNIRRRCHVRRRMGSC